MIKFEIFLTMFAYAQNRSTTRGTYNVLFIKDPHELNNLANNPVYSSVVTEMKALLKKMPEKIE